MNKLLRLRSTATILAAAVLLLGSLFLSAPSADAVQSGPVCDEGDLVGSTCTIEGAPPVNGPPSCPDQPDIIDEGGECYRLVAPEECPPGTYEFEDECRIRVAYAPGSLECPVGADGGVVDIVDGVCIQVEPASSELVCVDGLLQGDVCVIEGPPPQPGPPTCPTGSHEIDGIAGCWRTVALQPPCPDGSTLVAGECRIRLALAPSALECIEDFALVDGRCIQVRPPTVELTCEFGVLEGDKCVIDLGPPIQGPPTCPADPNFAEDAQGCYKTVGESGCPLGTQPDPGTDLCREAAALIPGPLMCAEGFDLVVYIVGVGARCLKTVDAVYRCAGLDVTINLLLGDAGRGTNGADVILGTPGDDVISGRGGDDVICAGGGADRVWGGRGNDRIYGQAGADRISGGSGADQIRGNGGDDWLRGNAGDDRLVGGGGTDRCDGGAGSDVAASSCEIVRRAN